MSLRANAPDRIMTRGGADASASTDPNMERSVELVPSEDHSRGGGRPILAHDVTLHTLVVGKPTRGFAESQNRDDQLAGLSEAKGGKVDINTGAAVTRANVLVSRARGIHDIDGRLAVADLLHSDTPPQRIFLNACECGRLRGEARQGATSVKLPDLAAYLPFRDPLYLLRRRAPEVHGDASGIATVVQSSSAA
jgi:hypothetical protein